MGIVHHLTTLALRPVALGSRSAAGDAAALLAERLGRVGPRLVAALREAGERAWTSLEIALAGESEWERWQSALTAEADQQLREALRAFLDNNPLLGRLDLMADSVVESAGKLQEARLAGQLRGGDLTVDDLGRLCAGWLGAADEEALRAVEQEALRQVADELKQIGQAPPAGVIPLHSEQGPALIAALVRTNLRRIIDQTEALRQELPLGPEEDLSEAQNLALMILAVALEQHGGRVAEVLAGAPSPEATLEDRPLDLRTALQGHPPHVQQLGQELLQALQAYQLGARELRARDCLAMHNEDDRRLANQLLARANELNSSAPALLNAAGKLKALAGALEAAQHDFQTAAGLLAEPRARAEAWASAFQVALERRQGPEALAAFKQAATLDPERFALFPLAKYEPVSVLRSDGVGVVFLCRQRSSNTTVSVETFRSELLDRPAAELFHEAQVLDALERPAILRLRDCEFADAAQTRPYMVCDHFEGTTLAGFVEQHGPLPAEDFLAIARQVLDAVQAAHTRGILHRNLRPGNILVRKEPGGWRVKVHHFGLGLRRGVLRSALANPAAVSRTLLGTLAARTIDFAAPEQLGRLPGTVLGPYTDVFSFGRLGCFALLKTPEPDDEEKEHLPLPLRKLLGQCTSTTPARRLPNMVAILDRLVRSPHAAAAPALARPSEPPAVARPDPREAEACVQRGIAHRQKGELDKALVEFNKALRLDPSNTLAYQGRGNTFASQGDYDKAIADYTSALRIDAKLPQALVNRGLAFIKKKETDKAIADYTSALQLDPKLSLAFLNRGSAYARRGDFDKAIADFTAALRIDPRLPLAFFNRGLAHAKKAEHDQAIADYSKALELTPTNAEIRSKLQDSLKAKGQKPAAPAAAAGALPRVSKAEAGASPAAGTAPPVVRPGGSRVEVKPTTEHVILEGHTEPVRCVAFSPDGRRLVSGSEDKTIRLWDAKTGKKLGRFTGHGGGVLAVAFSPDSSHVLTGGQDKTVRLWAVETGEEVRKFTSGGFFGGGGHSEAVVSVAFGPDGKRAVSASWDKTIRLWDVTSGKEIRCFEGHNWLIHSVAFSPDGKHFLFGSEDTNLRMCDIETGQEVHRFPGHTSWVLSVAFSADGRLALSGSSDGTMRLWSVARGRELRRFGGQMGLVQSVAFSPDGKRALSGEYTLPGENTLMRLWDVETANELARFTGHKQLIWSVAFAPDARHAASASADQTIRLWKLP